MAHVVLAHLFADKVLADNALGHAFLQQSEEEVFLVNVGVLLVLAEEGVLAEDLAAGAHEPAIGREGATAFLWTPVDRQPGLPSTRMWIF